MTTPVSSTTSPFTSTTPATTTASPSTDPLGKDTFLKLLVAQLKYQNPMNPTDSTAFLAQTAQFTMVEKLDDILTQVSSLATNEKLSAAASFLNRKVAYNTTDGEAKVGVVSGYTLDPSNGPMLRVGEDDVPIVMVTAVTNAPDAGTAPATTPYTTTSDSTTTPTAATPPADSTASAPSA